MNSPEKNAESVSVSETDAPADAIALQILNAASRRFLHYGYGKTTMSEIAKDCNMSTGNLYRYFPSKLDIAEAFVQGIRSDQLRRLDDVLAAVDQTPESQLREFLRLKFKLAYDRFHDRPKAFELSSVILSERPAFAVEWEAAESAALVKILERGEAAGAFVIADKAKTARIIQDAAFRFTTSAVFHEGDFDSLADELDQIVDLILDAFAYRKMRATASRG